MFYLLSFWVSAIRLDNILQKNKKNPIPKPHRLINNLHNLPDGASSKLHEQFRSNAPWYQTLKRADLTQLNESKTNRFRICHPSQRQQPPHSVHDHTMVPAIGNCARTDVWWPGWCVCAWSIGDVAVPGGINISECIEYRPVILDIINLRVPFNLAPSYNSHEPARRQFQ